MKILIHIYLVMKIQYLLLINFINYLIRSPNRLSAEAALEDLATTQEKKYPYAIKGWRTNWEELTVFFEFPVEIRKIIYATNMIENLNGMTRKYTKNRLSFPTNEAVMKSVCLAIQETTKKWTRPILNWAVILNQFLIIFEDILKM